jgi:hypothetical protein
MGIQDEIIRRIMNEPALQELDYEDLIDKLKIFRKYDQVINYLASVKKKGTKKDILRYIDEIEGKMGIQKPVRDNTQLKQDIEKWVEDERLHFYVNDHGWWILFKNNKWKFIKRGGLEGYNKKTKDPTYFDLLDEVLNEKELKVFDLTHKWTKEKMPYYLNLLEWDFCQPVESPNYHWFFDVLISSIGGGKQENITHIERLILNKYLHPEDQMLPALVLNDRGRTGKGLLAEILLPTVFGKDLVAVNIDIKNYIGNFNSVSIGKAVIAINETNDHEQIDMNALKSKLMTSTIVCNEKNKPEYFTNVTCLVIIQSNEFQGAMRVTGDPSDDRLSIVNGGIPIYDILVKDSRLNIPNKTSKICEDWIKSVAIPTILQDKTEVGKWLYCMYQKHGDVQNTSCLHGADYKKLLGVQQPFHIEIIEAIFNDTTFTHIKKSVLRDYYQQAYYITHKHINFMLKPKNFNTAVENWLLKNKPTIMGDKKNLTHGNDRITQDVWIDTNTSPKFVNDDLYLEYFLDGKVKQLNFSM